MTTTASHKREATRALIEPCLPLAGGVITALRAIVREQGFVDAEAAAVVADAFNISRAEVHGIISFYEDLRDRPGGRRVLRLCRAEACQAMGARSLQVHAESRLGVGLGSTTADREWALEAVYCLGLCACAPAISIDNRAYGRVDPARFDALLAEAQDD